MITRIEALNFRCLTATRKSLGAFHVLVGPNGGGKSAFLSIPSFLARLAADGVEAAVAGVGPLYQDVVAHGSSGRLELAIELAIPEDLRPRLRRPSFDTFRYEVALDADPETGGVLIAAERGLLMEPRKIPAPEPEPRQLDLFDMKEEAPPPALPPIVGNLRGRDRNTVFHKAPGGHDNFYSETYGEAAKGWNASVRLGARRSCLAWLPGDEADFPVTTWFRRHLGEGVCRLKLHIPALRAPCPPGRPRRVMAGDGSNLPWMIESLRAPDLADRYRQWISCISRAVPDLEGVETVAREGDGCRYVVLRYRGGFAIPSWAASAGTLRFLALSLPAFLPHAAETLLLDEPENGLHPRAVETVFQALASAKGRQVVLATHSPVILSLLRPEDVLCFTRMPGGGTEVVSGPEHPALKDWRGDHSMADLLGAGLLGC